MEESLVGDQLRDLLAEQSVETRYGAFRALRQLDPNNPAIKGELMGGQFSYHVLDTSGPPLVHITRNRCSEVVLFGREQRLLTPLAIYAGPRIMVTSSGGDHVSVSRFAPHETDQARSVSPRLDDVLRAAVELGATYPDVVQMLQEAKASGALEGRFEVDALPETGRVFDREAQGEDKDQRPGAKG